MFLKSLTLRGFKSFADKTVLEFEPGVMVVVGPNGSGKSNLVDAVAWVLGAQGPRTLRGGKMDDVIFAGTADRPALGRAEVSLTIDNSANLLPIEFSEVTITRTLFRNGDSEYAINGAPCRLLDIQELLSDSGIGRQQHVIVGQGQLDSILNSRPEDRRAVIEEAAGILKYRKRREKAERRLEATEGNLLRLNDLLREVRRGLGPLAEAGRRGPPPRRRRRGAARDPRAPRRTRARRAAAEDEPPARAGGELQREEAAIQGRLRDLDVSVLDAERALTDVGHGDLADALHAGRVDAGAGARSARRWSTSAAAGSSASSRPQPTKAWSRRSSPTRARCAPSSTALEPESGRARRARSRGRGRASGPSPATRAELVADDRGRTIPVAEAEAVRRELAARRDGLRAHRGGAGPLRRAGARARAAQGAARVRPRRRDREAAGRRVDRAERRRRGRRPRPRPGPAPRRSSTAAESRLAEAESEAGKWQGRADALAQALDAANDAEAAAVLDGMVGVAGALGEPPRDRARRRARGRRGARRRDGLGDRLRPRRGARRDRAARRRRRVGVAARARRHRHRGHHRRHARSGRGPTARRVRARQPARAAGDARPHASPGSCSPTATGAPRWTSPSPTRTSR